MSPDPVVDFCVKEAIAMRGGEAKKDALEKAKKDAEIKRFKDGAAESLPG